MPSLFLSAALLLSSPLLLCLTCYFYLVPNVLKDPRRRKLPPGPRGLPFIGNLLDFADSESVRGKVIRWQKQYGPIFYTKLGGTDYIWLSSPRAVKDLLDKKSNMYSSRPELPLAQGVLSGGRRQLFMPYGARWRKVRKQSHELLNLKASISYQPVQDFESKQLLVDLLNDPANFYMMNRRYAASVIMRVTYGYRIPTWDNPLIRDIYKVLDNFTTMTAPGAYAIDSFPSLTFLPSPLLGNWRSTAHKAFTQDSTLYLSLWDTLKRSVDCGTAPPCFTRTFYESDPSSAGIDDLTAAYTCGGLVEAGAETTATTLNNFLLCMVLFPQVQARAQEEIEGVVGGRMPGWGDEGRLPFVRGVVKEVLRWRPVNKFGMAHASSEEGWYGGYFLPRGAVVMLNWWAIHRDPSLFPSPDAFLPERYLDHTLSAAESINAVDPYARDHFSYGAGRRVCPGVHVAERSLFINIVRVLWGFHITKKVGADGKVIEPSQEMVEGFFSVPVPFECDIRPRSAEREKVMREEFRRAEEEGVGM